MTETPMEAAARALLDVMLGDRPEPDDDIFAGKMAQAAINTYLTACLADPATVEKAEKAVRGKLYEKGPDPRYLVVAAIKALIDE